MKLFHVRKISVLFAVCFALIFVCACSIILPPSSSSNDCLEVLFIDVGQGDSTLIKFPDDKIMLIDCGGGQNSANQNILKELNARNIQDIDYFILTHPSYDHVGGVASLLETKNVKNAYVPKIINEQLFYDYSIAINIIREKGANVKVSCLGEYIIGEGYAFTFLSPTSITQSDSSYRDLNFSSSPTEEQINDVSPIMYLQCNGARFVINGDAGFSQENLVVNNYNSSIYNALNSAGVNVNLNSVHVLKVSHHGGENASGKEFLDIVRPKNAVISVGGNNNYNHPSSKVLGRILSSNENCNILRTDVLGTIKITVNKDGLILINK